MANGENTAQIPNRRQALWNTAAGLLNAAEAVIMSMVATRTMDLSAAGVLTIAFAAGNLLRTIGLWGTRNYQVSDSRKEYGFSAYLKARIVNILIMAISGIFYGAWLYLFRGDPVSKIAVILMIIFIYVIESFEDVLWGEYQRRGRLDIGAKLFLVRWGCLLLTYTVAAVFGAGPVLSVVMGVIISGMVFAGMVRLWCGLPKDADRDISGAWPEILKKTFPLFAASFLTFFVNNVAKYSMDYYYEDELQAIFGFLAMPVFAVELLSSFIYQPKLLFLSELWRDKEHVRFKREMLFQIIIIVFLTLLCMAGGYIIGIPVLSMLYATDLTGYRYELMIMLLGGGIMALTAYAAVILTIFRRQKELLWVYLIGTAASLLIIPGMVGRYGIRGAALGNLIALFVLMICSWGLLCYIMMKTKKRGKGNV